MRIVIYSLALWLCFGGYGNASSKSDYTENTVLTDSELDIFKQIKNKYSDFHFTNKVVKYYSFDPVSNVRRVELIEMVFDDRKEGLYFEKYSSYVVSFEPYSWIIKYSFDGGTAWRGEGTYTVLDADNIVKTERSCGLGGCSVEVCLNNKSLKTISMSNDYYDLE